MQPEEYIQLKLHFGIPHLDRESPSKSSKMSNFEKKLLKWHKEYQERCFMTERDVLREFLFPSN
ncbi:hypothetical protein [Okeania sp. SIO1I7]|uniref:hypothetical protein n=1 Tax=Okeania sp. SIO1I7 TaxID=2607772 RepID=UPI0013FBF352|nr:hypothetical protein [Okeania sp. SIO1I7]NET29517.1 hypothetical protein [Okeania sp. SIO1I7]